MFISINTSYEELLKTLDQASQVEREIIDLEDQVELVILDFFFLHYFNFGVEKVNTESQNKTADNLEKVIKDLSQIKEENEKLIAKIKSSN